MENIVLAEIFAQILYNQREVTATRSRRKTQIKPTGVFQIHLKALQFIQLLDTALYLYRLGRFIPETLNELLRISDHLLLIHVRPHLLFMPLLAQFNKTAVVDIIVVDTSEGDFYCAGTYIVDKSLVVTNQQYRGRTGLKEIFQPLNRLNIQVVGRLIQQQ